MGTTIEDVQYDEYIEDLLQAYIEALERLPESKSLVDLRKNLTDLRKAQADVSNRTRKQNRQSKELECVLNDVATLEKIYEMLIEQKKKGTVFFFLGVSIGTAITVLSSLFL